MRFGVALVAGLMLAGGVTAGKSTEQFVMVNAPYGDSRVNMSSWGSTAVNGIAVRFKTDAAPVATPAAKPALAQRFWGEQG